MLRTNKVVKNVIRQIPKVTTNHAEFHVIIKNEFEEKLLIKCKQLK